MRSAPRPLTAVVVFLIYLAIFYGVWIVTDVDYNTIGDSADNLMKWYAAPTWAGGLFLALAVTVLGWWRPVLFEKERAQQRWIVIAPAYMLLVVIVLLVFSDFSALTGGMVGLLLLGSVGVGFAEEVSSRGVLVTGFRGSLTEPWVWFYSCLLFGLLHLPNWVFGVGPGAVGQVVLAFGGGSVFYLLRRFSGTLLWAIALHAVWDFATIGGESSNAVGALVLLNSLLGFVLGGLLMSRERGRRVEQAGVPDTTAPAGAEVA